MKDAERVRAAVDALSARLERAVAAWRAHLREEAAADLRPTYRARPRAPDIEAVKSVLEQQVAEVADEAKCLREAARQEDDAAASWERRAMMAAQREDSAGALEALEQHALHATAAAALRNDLRILDAMAETCHEALRAHSVVAPPA